MTAVTYIAKRSIISGHVLDGEYSLDLKCTDLLPRRRVNRVKRVPLAGVGAEVIRNFAFDEYLVVLAPLGGPSLKAVREFLDSVEDASFTFDPYGRVATPGTDPAPFEARIEDDGFGYEPFMRLGTGGGADLHQIRFTVVPK